MPNHTVLHYHYLSTFFFAPFAFFAVMKPRTMPPKLPPFLLRLPGLVASILMILITTLWAFWGISEMYHEGWWGAWYNRLPYLAPLALTLLPTLVAFRWPLAGGLLISGVGIFSLAMFGGGVAVIALAILLVGLAFLLDGVIRRKSPPPEPSPALPLWRQVLREGHWRYWLALGLPLVVLFSVSVYMLPLVLSRQDDGYRGAVLIEGNGVSLVWAPEGPGWNWRQDWGGYPSWQAVALYGLPLVGLGDKPGYGRGAGPGGEDMFASAADMQTYNLCRYLSEDGLALMDTPQDIWRMPTAEELLRSLVRHGENAGCRWDGLALQQAECSVQPDKESPLWATDQPAIYYWAAESYDDELGIFVSFNGWINAAYKTGGNPRHSYRCVRAP